MKIKERKERKNRKIKNKRVKNKNAPQFFLASIKILESFEDKSILNLFQPCAIQ
jgi:hypothetical protein